MPMMHTPIECVGFCHFESTVVRVVNVLYPREIDYFEKEWVISLFRPPLEEVGGPTHT